MYVWLAGRAAMLAYGPHPKHQELMALQARALRPARPPFRAALRPAPFRAGLDSAGTSSGSAAVAHAASHPTPPRALRRPAPYAVPSRPPLASCDWKIIDETR